MDENEVGIDEQVRVAKGVLPGNPSLCPVLSPLVVATTMFDDAKGLANDKLLRFVTDRGVDTGVSLGGLTVHFSRLGLRERGIGETPVAGVAYGFMGRGKVYDSKHNDRERVVGILLLGGDEDPYWFWSTVYMPYFTSKPECVQLKVDELAELMTGQDGARPILEPYYTYGGFIDLLDRKVDQSLRVSKQLSCQLGNKTTQLGRFRQMAGRSSQ
jgi:hypothetical protein